MPYGLYIAAEGALAQSQRMDVLSNNLANADTVGFKRQLAIFQARYAEATDRGLDYPGSGSINDSGGGVTVQETKTDFAPGVMEDTGVPTDAALAGEGFFQVLNGEEIMLTRAGNFSLTPRGELVTVQGYPVLNEAGGPIILDPTLPTPKISDDGGITQGNGPKQFLGIVKPAELADLVQQGENLFRSLSQPIPVGRAQRHVRGGYLEKSSVRPTMEMMELIEASRAFEAQVNLIRQQDQLLGSAASRMLAQGR